MIVTCPADSSLTADRVKADRSVSADIAQWLLDHELIIDMNEDVSGEKHNFDNRVCL